MPVESLTCKIKNYLVSGRADEGPTLLKVLCEAAECMDEG